MALINMFLTFDDLMLLDWNLLNRLPEQVLFVFQEKDEFQQVGGFFYLVFFQTHVSAEQVTPTSF